MSYLIFSLDAQHQSHVSVAYMRIGLDGKPQKVHIIINNLLNKHRVKQTNYIKMDSSKTRIWLSYQPKMKNKSIYLYYLRKSINCSQDSSIISSKHLDDNICQKCSPKPVQHTIRYEIVSSKKPRTNCALENSKI